MKINWPNITKIKSSLIAGTALVAIIFLIGFAERKIGATTFEEVKVTIDNQYDNYFLHENDVMAMLSSNVLPVTGSKYSQVELRNIENTIKKIKFVENVQVHKDCQKFVFLYLLTPSITYQS